jgi:predicted GNAT superfamily acetyltransferase
MNAPEPAGTTLGARDVKLIVSDAARDGLAAAASAGVEVRELRELADLDQVYRLYDSIWRPDPKNPPVTTELLRALTKAGNYVGGAYDGDTLIGACVGFFGAPAEVTMHSHVAGVSGTARGRNVGFALKLHQRAWALERGVTAISWTFDPLIRRNAYFNLTKLAALPTEYLTNFYGLMADGINNGDDSDRLLVRWQLDDPAVVAAAHRPTTTATAGTSTTASTPAATGAGAGAIIGSATGGGTSTGTALNSSTSTSSGTGGGTGTGTGTRSGTGSAPTLSSGTAATGTRPGTRSSPASSTLTGGRLYSSSAFPTPSGHLAEMLREATIALGVADDGRPIVGDLHGSGGTVLVAVPADIEGLRGSDPGAAKEWRVALREVLGGLLADGAQVTGFDRAGWYVLEQPVKGLI